MQELDTYFDTMYQGIDNTIHLDKEQREAILCDDENTMIIAGAGSGKTTTMASKVKYLIDIKKVKPAEILVISFTNQATLELQERIQKQFSYPVDILTFHKLGLKILKQSGFSFQEVIEEPLSIIKQYFLSERSNRYVKQLFLLCNEPYTFVKYQEKRKILEENQMSLSLDYYVDNLERKVANLLFLYQIPFLYQKEYSYHKGYFPDFTLPDGVYIECFGNVEPRFSKKFQKQKGKILSLHASNHTNLLIIEKEEDIFSLKEKLSTIFSCQPLSNYELKKYLFSIKKYSNILLSICGDFIKDFKIQGNTIDDFKRLKKRYSDKLRSFFLDLMQDIYLFYQEQLNIRQAIDFDDMILKAKEVLSQVSLPYRYIIVDEYQDISKSRFLLVKEMANKCQSKVIAVGDDFQSIFAFAGSDITLFTDFKKMMGKATQLKITHTYRNSQQLIEVAGSFVMKNPKQITKTLVSPKTLEKPIRILVYDKKKPRNQLLENAIEEIIMKVGKDKSILLLGRYNFEKKQVLSNSHFQEQGNHIVYDKYPNTTIDFLSVHSSKGLGYDNVIVVNMEEDIYGFPSKVQDTIFKRIDKKEEEMLFEEERRLFYVALTRTKNYVYLLTPLINPSQFILEIMNDSRVYVSNQKIKKLSKRKVCPKCGMPLKRSFSPIIFPLYTCTNQKEICNFKTNDLWLRIPITLCPSCKKGYMIVKENNNQKFLGCTNYPKGCHYTKSI